MNYAIVTTDYFDERIKQLMKKYRSIPDDLEILKADLLKNPTIGNSLGDNTHKIRMAIASKNKGKRGGARVISCNVLVNVDDTDIYLLTIYDKGERDSISVQEIRKLKCDCGLI